jgi:hypothetical protein
VHEMIMDVRLGRIAGVAAQAERVTALHFSASFYSDSALFEMGQYRELIAK